MYSNIMNGPNAFPSLQMHSFTLLFVDSCTCLLIVAMVDHNGIVRTNETAVICRLLLVFPQQLILTQL